MKEQDLGYVSREGFGGAIEGWNGCIDEGAGYAIKGWGTVVLG